jgi:CBS domain pair.
MQGSQIIGIVTRRDVFNALATHARDPYVTEIMRRDFLSVQADSSLDEVYSLMADV